MTEILLLAQSVAPGSGWEGWTGAGLLGCVLGWLLLKHLPAKDQQLKEYVEFKDNQLKKVLEDKDAALADLAAKYERKLEVVAKAFEKEAIESRIEFKRALDTVMAHCTEETRRIIEVFRGRPPDPPRSGSRQTRSPQPPDQEQP